MITNEKKIARSGDLGSSVYQDVSGSYVNIGPNEARPMLLLHSCCGPCSTAVIERLASDYNITVFYYNPCITEEDEYIKRKENQIKFIKMFNENSPSRDTVKFIEGDYYPDKYLELIKGHEKDPEGGERCNICFRQRLMETARKAKELEMDIFSTTLTVSPHKNYKNISAIGKEVSSIYEIEYLDMDFKKKAGFQRSVQLAKEYELYRQDFCGCIFSKTND